MVIYLNANGTIQQIYPSILTQGSNTDSLVVITNGFSDGSAISVTFELPNGDKVNGGIMIKRQNFVVNDEYVAAYTYDLNKSLTNYCGLLKMSFEVVGAGLSTTSYILSVNVIKSLAPVVPTQPSDDEWYAQILAAYNYILQQVDVDIPQDITDAMSEHNTSATAHADIRQKIADDIAAHNSSETAHSYIRGLITALGERVSTNEGDISDLKTLTSGHTTEINNLKDGTTVIPTYELKANKINDWEDASENTYPNAKLVKDTIDIISRDKAYVFDTEQDFLDWLDGDYTRGDGVVPSDLRIGDEILIKESGVSDYWVSSKSEPMTIDDFSPYDSGIDLTNYVQNTTKIAGIDLQDDITVNELKSALDVPAELNAGEGIDIASNTISIKPSTKTTLGGSRIWQEDDDVYVRTEKSSTYLFNLYIDGEYVQSFTQNDAIFDLTTVIDNGGLDYEHCNGYFLDSKLLNGIEDGDDLSSSMVYGVCNIYTKTATPTKLSFTLDSENLVYSVQKIDTATTTGVVVVPKQYDGKDVTSLDERAFENCSGLTEFVMPSNITALPQYIFYYCTGLTKISLSNSIESIYENAFEHCEALVQITIPSSVTTLDAYAFASCVNLQTAYIPNSVTTLGRGIFNHCSSLVNTSLPSGITEIGRRMFTDCAFTAIEIPSGVTSIGEDAFRNCSNLTSIDIPENVNSIDSSVFIGCSSLAQITVNSNNTTYSCPSGSNCVIETATNTLVLGCKNTVIPNTVTGIGNNAFRGSGVISVSLPSSVTSIGTNAFMGCTGLISVTLPNNLTVLGDKAFAYCSNLVSITVPGSITSFGNEVFSNCTYLRTVVLSQGLTSIGATTFKGCTSLATIVIPSGVTAISYDVFRDCTSLKSVTIPEGVTYIWNNTFRGCSSLKIITIPASVSSLGTNVFTGSGLTTAIFKNPNGWSIGGTVRNGGDIHNSSTAATYLTNTYVGYEWSRKDTNFLTFSSYSDGYSVVGMGNKPASFIAGKVIIPSTYNGLPVRQIGVDAFEGYNLIESVEVPSNVNKFGGAAFSGCSSLKRINLTSGITGISYDTFKNCASLTDIVITENVTYIWNDAFNGCTALTSINIPASITEFGTSTFNGCSSLATIIIDSSTIAGLGSSNSHMLDNAKNVYVKSTIALTGAYIGNTFVQVTSDKEGYKKYARKIQNN